MCPCVCARTCVRVRACVRSYHSRFVFISGRDHCKRVPFNVRHLHLDAHVFLRLLDPVLRRSRDVAVVPVSVAHRHLSFAGLDEPRLPRSTALVLGEQLVDQDQAARRRRERRSRQHAPHVHVEVGVLHATLAHVGFEVELDAVGGARGTAVAVF